MLNKGEKQIKKVRKADKAIIKPIAEVTEADIQAALGIVNDYSESTVRKVARGVRNNSRIARVLRELVIARQNSYRTVEQINQEEE